MEGELEEEDCRERQEGFRQEVANLGENKGEVPKEVRFLHLAVPVGIEESQTTRRLNVGGRKKRVFAEIGSEQH